MVSGYPIVIYNVLLSCAYYFLTIYWSTQLWFITYYFHVRELSYTLFLSQINYKPPLSTVVNFGMKLISYTLTTLGWFFQWWCRWDQDWKETQRFPPNNVLLTLAGAGLLWLGWAGFNGGDPYAANIDSSMAVLNTNICAATSLLMWTSLDVIFFNKPSVIGAVQGMITGLVCITPGAGDIIKYLN